MKKNYLLTLLLAALAAGSCSKNEMLPAGIEETGYTLFKASVGSGALESRTTLDALSGKVSWAEGDAIKVLWKDGTPQNAVSEPLAASSIAQDGSAVFRAECEPVGNTYAVYPSTVDAEYVDYVKVVIPSVQDGDFAHCGILASKWDGSRFSFRQVCGFLQFSVPEGVDRVVWSADNLSPIAGKADVGFPDGEITVAAVGDGVHEITVNVSGAGTYYVAVAPGDYESMYVAMFEGETLKGEKRTFNKVSVARGQMKKMGTLPADGTFLSDKFFVKPAGTGDGSSWDNAAGLSDLLAKLSAEGNINAYLASGTYSVTEEVALANTGTKNVYGGYPADASGVSLIGRDVKANETVFDGGNNNRIFVVSKSEINFDGLVFQNAKNTANNIGSALILQSSGALQHRVNNCVFRDNNNTGAACTGGAMRIAGNLATTTVSNCLFENNVSACDGGALGVQSGNAIFRNNVFRNNKANGTKLNGAESSEVGGGAIKITNANSNLMTVSFDGDLFEGNTAAKSASAVYCKANSTYAYEVKFNNCVFINNSANSRGCVRSNSTVSKVFFNACTFAANKMVQYGNSLHLQTPAAIHNCVFYNNVNSSATGASVIYHDKDILITNSTIRLGGASTTGINHVGGVESIIANNIIWNNGSSSESGNAKSSIVVASGKTLTSYGHNIIGLNNADAATKPVSGSDFVTNSAEHSDHIYVFTNAEGNTWKLDPTWVSAPWYLLKWTAWPAPGKPEGFELATPARVEAAIDAFDTATGLAFKAWLNEIGALNADHRGTLRSDTAIWPGSYDNSATSSL